MVTTAPRLDIVIPVYNEGANIRNTLQSIARAVTSANRVLICYDREDDDTLPAIAAIRDTLGGLAIENVRNTGRGAHGAVLSGFAASTYPTPLGSLPVSGKTPRSSPVPVARCLNRTPAHLRTLRRHAGMTSRGRIAANRLAYRSFGS